MANKQAPISQTAAVGVESMMLEWNDLNVILAVCRAGTLSGAARSLGQNHSTIYRKINTIENKTGVRFFERLPDGYAMTDAGRTALSYAERIENEVHALSREVLGQDLKLQGKVRVTAPEGFTVTMAPKLFAKFRRAHPDVTIDIVGGSAAMDLTRREADLAIRATSKPPDTSLGKKICDFRFAVYASPRYIKQVTDVALAEHQWSFIAGTVDWLVPLIWKKKAHGERQVVFSSSNSISVLNATAEGMGLTLMPCYLADQDKRLVRVSEPVNALTLELWILTHVDLRNTARVKALMAYVYEALRDQSDLFEGTRPANPPLVQFKL